MVVFLGKRWLVKDRGISGFPSFTPHFLPSFEIHTHKALAANLSMSNPTLLLSLRAERDSK